MDNAKDDASLQFCSFEGPHIRNLSFSFQLKNVIGTIPVRVDTDVMPVIQNLDRIVYHFIEV